MGRGFLLFVRVLTMLLALANAITNSYLIRTSKYGFKFTWNAWLSLFLGVITDITFTWAIKAHRAQVNIIKSNKIRHTCSFLLCAAWLVSPSYEVNYLLDYLRRNYATEYFFEFWNCKEARCQINFACDLLGFFMAFFVFLEAILAHRYERSSKALMAAAAAAAAKPVTDVSAVVVEQQQPAPQPAPQPAKYAPMQQQQQPYAQQQQPYVQQQQPYAQQPYAYHPAQQPAQPAAYYPQPAMTAPYQTPAMPYQAPTTPYQVPQQPPTYQPYPPKY